MSNPDLSEPDIQPFAKDREPAPRQRDFWDIVERGLHQRELPTLEQMPDILDIGGAKIKIELSPGTPSMVGLRNLFSHINDLHEHSGNEHGCIVYWSRNEGFYVPEMFEGTSEQVELSAEPISYSIYQNRKTFERLPLISVHSHATESPLHLGDLITLISGNSGLLAEGNVSYGETDLVMLTKTMLEHLMKRREHYHDTITRWQQYTEKHFTEIHAASFDQYRRQLSEICRQLGVVWYTSRGSSDPRKLRMLK